MDLYRTAAVTRLPLSLLAVLLNGLVFSTVCSGALRNQHHYLRLNLAASDILMGVSHLLDAAHTLANDRNTVELKLGCLGRLVPHLWGMYAVLCATVPMSIYKIQHTPTEGVTSANHITEKMIFVTSICNMWIFTFIGAMLSLSDVADQKIPVCMVPLAASTRYFSAHSMFVISVTGIVCMQNVQLIAFLGKTNDASLSSARPNWHKLITHDSSGVRKAWLTVLVFAAAWLPVCVGNMWCLLPQHDRVAFTYMHFATILPLCGSCMNPFLYTLSESNIRNTIAEFFRTQYWKARRTRTL